MTTIAEKDRETAGKIARKHASIGEYIPAADAIAAALSARGAAAREDGARDMRERTAKLARARIASDPNGNGGAVAWIIAAEIARLPLTEDKP